jgi:hypothetical protein
MEFNATFNNISGISWRSVLLVEETTDHFLMICFQYIGIIDAVVAVIA